MIPAVVELTSSISVPLFVSPKDDLEFTIVRECIRKKLEVSESFLANRNYVLYNEIPVLSRNNLLKYHKVSYGVFFPHYFGPELN